MAVSCICNFDGCFQGKAGVQRRSQRTPQHLRTRVTQSGDPRRGEGSCSHSRGRGDKTSERLREGSGSCRANAFPAAASGWACVLGAGAFWTRFDFRTGAAPSPACFPPRACTVLSAWAIGLAEARRQESVCFSGFVCLFLQRRPSAPADRAEKNKRLPVMEGFVLKKKKVREDGGWGT